MAKVSQVRWGRIDRSGPGVLAHVEFKPELGRDSGFLTGRRIELICDAKVVGYVLPTTSSDLNVALYQDFPFDKVEILTEAVETGGGLLLRPANSIAPASTMRVGEAELYCQLCGRITRFRVWRMVEASQVGRKNPEYVYRVSCSAQRQDKSGRGQPYLSCRWEPKSKLQIAVAVARATVNGAEKETSL